MNTIILFINPYKWSVKQWHANKGGHRTISGRLIVQNGEEWLSLSEEKNIFDDYDDKEITEVKKKLPLSLPYIVEWRGDGLLSIFLQEADSSSVIDNDHGLICTIKDLENIPIKEWKMASSISQIQRKHIN